MFRLDGAVAVVTGACGRLGPIWVDALLGAGAAVAALDLAGAHATESDDAVRSRAPEGALRHYSCDVTDRTAVDEVRDAVTRDLGVPAVLVNNAGIDQPPDSATGRFLVEDVPAEIFRRMVEVNLIGTFQVTQSFGPGMVAKRRGSIINIGSLYASVVPDPVFYDHMPGAIPFLKLPAYGSSKAGVVNLTKFFATHWGPYGVRVNTLSPGGVLGSQDPQFKKKYSARVPLGRLAEAADLAGPLLFLASDAASYVTGHELRVDGGFTAW